MSKSERIRAVIIRGGTSKGVFLLASDLPDLILTHWGQGYSLRTTPASRSNVETTEEEASYQTA